MIEPALQITQLNNVLKVNFPHPFYFRGEFHPFWEMVYAVDGTFRVAGNERVYTMRKGNVIFHKPMEFHRLWSVEQEGVHAYIIGFCATGKLLRKLEEGAFELSEEQQRQLEALMAYVAEQFSQRCLFGWNYLEAMEKQKDEKEVQIQRCVELLELFLLSLGEDLVQLTVKERSQSEDSRIFRQTVQMLADCVVGGWLNVEQVAQRLHCSSTRVKRAFAKYSDIGVHKYLLKLKMTEAIRLLRLGHTCNEISQTLGFSDQSYFSVVFKRETGYSPSYYARQTDRSLQEEDTYVGEEKEGKEPPVLHECRRRSSHRK